MLLSNNLSRQRDMLDALDHQPPARWEEIALLIGCVCLAVCASWALVELLR